MRKLTSRRFERSLVSVAVICAVVSGPLWITATAQQKTADTPRARIDAAVKEKRFGAALLAYDDYVKGTGRADASTLAVIARALLRDTIDKQPDASVQSVPALERLARAGDAAALTELKALAKRSQGFSEDMLAPLLALSRVGDAGAQAELAARLDAAPAQQRVAVIQAVQQAQAKGASERVAAYLRDPEAGVRSAAAGAIGTLGYAKAIPVLEQMLRDDVGAVRMFAAMGLVRLGQPSGEAYLATLMKTPAPEIRLLVAAAYEDGKPGPWLGPVRELLKDPSPVNRVRAARIVACCDRLAAKTALVDALVDANPPLRAEAAATLEQKRLMDLALARKLLGDPSAAVYVPAAGAVLAAAGQG